jgi:hypothetical protein
MAIDFIFLIPYVEDIEIKNYDMDISLFRYLILLTSLIREKNAKVKEILKVLGIEPILNNLAHGIR